MIECGYIGRSHVMVRYMLEETNIHLAYLIIDGTPTDEMKMLISDFNLEFVVARNKKELKDAIDHHCCSIYIMYSCGIIVPEEITQKVKIINFHAGSLENNRGATPIVRSILRGDFYSYMSVFEIDGKIDCGKLLANRVVEIQQMDDSKTLKHKLEQTIPSLLSDIALDNNRIEKFYCKKVDEKDYKVELGSCSIEDIERIIKSQKMYNGAMINQQCITDINVKDYEWTKKEETETEISYEVKAKVVLKKKGFFENLEVWHKNPDSGWKKGEIDYERVRCKNGE